MSVSFNFVDFLIVVVIVISAGYAAWRGFLSETLSIFAWAAAAFATLYFGPWMVPLARGFIATPWAGSLAAYAAVFLVVFIPLSFMSYRFADSIRHSPIGPLDRALGVAFGVVRGLVVVGLGYLAFTYFVPVRDQPRWVTEARFLPLMQNSAEVLLSLIPGRDHTDFATVPGGRTKEDPLGALIERQNQAANAVPKTDGTEKTRKSEEKSAGKTYGAKDRRALDTLLKTGKP